MAYSVRIHSDPRSDSPWAPAHIPGIGEVPGGPRGIRRTSTSVATESRFSTGSSTVVPEIAERKPSKHLNQTAIKLEPMDEDTAALLSMEDGPQHGTNGNGQDETMITTADSGSTTPTSDQDYMHNFRAMWASHQRHAQKNGSALRALDEVRQREEDSERQESYDGTIRDRNDIAQLALRDRSRSPRRYALPSLPPSDRDSPMFYPENRRRRHQGSHDSGLGDSLASIGSSSISRSPDRDSPGNTADARDQCTCPVSYNCHHRHVQQLDCRKLVLEPLPRWEERDQEDFEKHQKVSLRGERFTTNQNLVRITEIIDEFEKGPNLAKRKREAKKMESWILSMEDVTLEGETQQDVATAQVVPRIRRFLSHQNRTLRRAGQLPGYIEEELTVLGRKWGKEDFSGAIKRGLIEVTVFDVNGIQRKAHYKLDKTYRFYTDARYIGAGELVNGQIWTSRLELCRDGVHAPSQAGISGTAKHGAYSIVMARGYANIDMGNVIEYMGTALPDQPGLGATNDEDLHMHHPNSWNLTDDTTKGTAALLKSFDTQQPVRVIRSFKMEDIVTNKPNIGYRYDGLYKVVGKTPMKEARQIWSFRLERLPKQLPHQGHLRGFRRHEAQPDSTGRRRGHGYIAR